VPDVFPETRWTRIVAARGNPDLRRAVLGELCASRWQPLYVHLRKQGLPPDRAQDVVQGFLAHLLERDFLARLDPGAAFDREWALGLFEGALAELEAELASGARRGPVGVVRQLFRFGEAPPYEALAAEHGLTVPQLKSFVHRARGRFRELLLARIADTVQTAQEAEAELGDLLKALTA